MWFAKSIRIARETKLFLIGRKHNAVETHT